MRLSKFVKIMGLALSFVNLGSSYGGKQILWIWETQKASQLNERGAEFVYCIQDISSLMFFVRAPDMFIGGTCMLSKECLLELLEDSDNIKTIKGMKWSTTVSPKFVDFLNALKSIIWCKERGLSFVKSRAWNEIVIPDGEFYYITESGSVQLVDPLSEETKKREVAGAKEAPRSDDCLMFREYCEACNANIDALLARLSKAGENDDASSIFDENYEKELEEMYHNPEFRSMVRIQPKRRDKSEPPSGIPSPCASPELKS